MRVILGISAYFHDSSACIIVEGEPVAAALEERFTRKKHDQSFPENAIRYCLKEADISSNEIDEVIKIAENENFVISKILYEYRSAEINETAAQELNKLVLILKKNKDVGVELSSHTDSKGTESYNLELSEKRAQKALEYVVSKGIDASRITAKGFGETQPVAPNELPNGKDNPEGRAKNRRTEFKVVKLK